MTPIMMEETASEMATKATSTLPVSYTHLRVIRFETIIATEQFAAESGFSEGDELWAVQRVRYLDGKALILDLSLIHI